MLQIFSLTSFLLLSSFLSYGQINIILPENPVIDSIPLNWKGHNHGSNVNISEIQTTEFIDAFSKLLVIFIKFVRHTLIFIGFALLLTVRCTETGML